MLQPPRIVLITGASSGIGLETARHFARGGAELLLVGRDPTRLGEAAAMTRAQAIRADLTQREDVARIAEMVAQRAGRLDVLVNCAGRLEVGPTTELGAAVAEELMQVNFFGPVALIDALLPLLYRGARPSIVNIASVVGRVSPPFMAAYAASKHALVAYSRTLRQELRPDGIHVGVVLPAPVATPMIQNAFGGPYYPRPPGLPVVTAAQVARAVVRCAERRAPELVVPRWMGGVIGLQAAFPGVTDLIYLTIGALPRARRLGAGGRRERSA